MIAEISSEKQKGRHLGNYMKSGVNIKINEGRGVLHSGVGWGNVRVRYYLKILSVGGRIAMKVYVF
jgi:hypothetical protein